MNENHEPVFFLSAHAIHIAQGELDEAGSTRPMQASVLSLWSLFNGSNISHVWPRVWFTSRVLRPAQDGQVTAQQMVHPAA